MYSQLNIKQYEHKLNGTMPIHRQPFLGQTLAGNLFGVQSLRCCWWTEQTKFKSPAGKRLLHKSILAPLQ